MRRFRLSLLSLCLLFLAGTLPCLAQGTTWRIARTFPLGGEGGWDYVTLDAPNHRLFVTRKTHTMAVDTDTGRLLADIPGQIGSHGVALVPRLGRGFITDGGGSGAIVIFDLKTYAVLGRVPALPDADGTIYDAKLDRVLAVSGDGGALMVLRPDVDPRHGRLEATIDLGGKPEFLAADNTGKVFVNLENKDLLAVVDLRTRKVLARWPVAPGGHPVGLALDPATHRLFVGCRNPQRLVVMNADNGSVEAALPIGGGVDATAFDRGQAFASARDGSLTVIGKRNGGWTVEQTVQTSPGARTMGLDPLTHRLYLPTSDLLPAATGKSKPKPGTFRILEVSPR